MRKIWVLAILAALFSQCRKTSDTMNEFKSFIAESTVQQTIDSLQAKYGEAQNDRITRGVKNTAFLWRDADGNASEFSEFCLNNFISDTNELDKLFRRISGNFEILFGNFNAISVGLRRPLDLDIGEVLPVDELFGSYSPYVHLNEDFFGNRIAFLMILNFPYYTLKEKTELENNWTRKDWAYARMGDVFDSRVPSDVNQLIANASNQSGIYISDYNIYAGKLLNNEGKTLFPPDMKLLSHWNIRDEIKSNYGKPDGLQKQQMLYEVMKRIVKQEIPEKVINDSGYLWNPYTNKVSQNDTEIQAEPEPNTRYARILDYFHAQQKADAYYPQLNTYISRCFESDMEIPLEDVEQLFTSYLSSQEVQKVAALIRKRLGRNLEPFDIWYDGFKTRTSIPAETLDNATRSRYPNPEAVQKDLAPMLVKLGFTPENAASIASRVQVDPARGSGHAWGAEAKDQKSLLRTRIFSNGMDYKGYNIAVHEFGHNVEQTISLHGVDYYMLRGVPNTAFTEAFAFMFQKNDLALLGFKDKDANQEYLNYLDNFWQLYEIMGVSLVDIGTWKWLYANPGASAEQLKDAVNTIAKDIWNKYYAPAFGMKDEPVLAIYSHMIDVPLYLPNYAYGHIIEFQLAEYLKDKAFAAELNRIYSQGNLIPQQWMEGAVGSRISVQPVLNAVNLALDKMQ
ncbi:MAG: hypothetical protein JXA72_10585 [Bacteroidales bacterium]|nr:hypothetical protein [Bacteroidales bacterium]